MARMSTYEERAAAVPRNQRKERMTVSVSRETRAYLATRPNRFKYVVTPKHGSWLNIVETLFGKMVRTFLRRIRVRSLDDLRQRILQGIAAINAMPVVHRWKSFQALEEVPLNTNTNC